VNKAPRKWNRFDDFLNSITALRRDDERFGPDLRAKSRGSGVFASCCQRASYPQVFADFCKNSFRARSTSMVMTMMSAVAIDAARHAVACVAVPVAPRQASARERRAS